MAFVREVMKVKSKKYAVVDEKRCVACGECTFFCRKNAVSVKNGCFALVTGVAVLAVDCAVKVVLRAALH